MHNFGFATTTTLKTNQKKGLKFFKSPSQLTTLWKVRSLVGTSLPLKFNRQTKFCKEGNLRWEPLCTAHRLVLWALYRGGRGAKNLRRRRGALSIAIDLRLFRKMRLWRRDLPTEVCSTGHLLSLKSQAEGAGLDHQAVEDKAAKNQLSQWKQRTHWSIKPRQSRKESMTIPRILSTRRSSWATRARSKSTAQSWKLNSLLFQNGCLLSQ